MALGGVPTGALGGSGPRRATSTERLCHKGARGAMGALASGGAFAGDFDCRALLTAGSLSNGGLRGGSRS